MQTSDQRPSPWRSFFAGMGSLFSYLPPPRSERRTRSVQEALAADAERLAGDGARAVSAFKTSAGL